MQTEIALSKIELHSRKFVQPKMRLSKKKKNSQKKLRLENPPSFFMEEILIAA